MNEQKETAPLRHGGMVIGGSGYPLHELARLEPLDRHSCGVPVIDGADGIYPGAVWTLAGPDAVGVTAFVLQLAASVNRAGGCVLVVNGHMATHHLYRRMVEAREAAGADGLFRGGVELASWIRLPSWRVDPQVLPTCSRQASTFCTRRSVDCAIVGCIGPCPRYRQQVLAVSRSTQISKSTY